MYGINTPVERLIWQNRRIIDTVCMSRSLADHLNGIEGIGVYFGFTQHEILNNGTEEELTAAGFIKEG